MFCPSVCTCLLTCMSIYFCKASRKSILQWVSRSSCQFVSQSEGSPVSLPVRMSPAGVVARLSVVSCMLVVWGISRCPDGWHFTSFLPPAQQECSSFKASVVRLGGEMSECLGWDFTLSMGTIFFSVIGHMRHIAAILITDIRRLHSQAFSPSDFYDVTVYI